MSHVDLPVWHEFDWRFMLPARTSGVCTSRPSPPQRRPAQYAGLFPPFLGGSALAYDPWSA